MEEEKVEKYVDELVIVIKKAMQKLSPDDFNEFLGSVSVSLNNADRYHNG